MSQKRHVLLPAPQLGRDRPGVGGAGGRASGRGNDAHGDYTPTGMPKTGRAGLELAAQPFCTDLALLQYRGCQQGPARTSGGRRRRRRHGRRRSGRLHARGRAGLRGPTPWGTLRRACGAARLRRGIGSSARFAISLSTQSPFFDLRFETLGCSIYCQF
jgi:hypothetical protein